MWRAPITLPTFSAFDTDLCLCFSIFGSFAPYPNYSPLLHCLIISAQAFSFEFSPIIHVLWYFICDHLQSLLVCFPWNATLFNISKFTLNCCYRSFAAFLPDISAIYQTLLHFHFAPLFVIRDEVWEDKVINTQHKWNPREVAIWIDITIWPYVCHPREHWFLEFSLNNAINLVCKEPV